MRPFFVLSVAFLFATCCQLSISSASSDESRENWATEAYLKNCPSVVFIQGDKVEERRGHTGDADRTFNGMGSGIIIDERGYIITNYHVVKDIRKIQVKTHDEQDYVATLVAKDADTDLALIKINTRSPLRPITFGRSNDLMPGEVCIAIGNPYGYVYSLTDGRIGAINREVGVNDSSLVYRAAIQTNTEINPGNSGGPLININGEMIGINVAIRQGAAGIAFATPVDQVVEVAAKLLGEVVGRQITHGLTVSQNEPRDYNAIKRFIIRVEHVESNSPAARAGIQKGDILTGIGKYTLRNKLDFYRAVLDLKANEEIAFSLFRNNELLDVSVAVATPRQSVMANRAVSPQTAAAAPQTAANHGQNPANSNSRPANTAATNSSMAELDKQVWDNLGIAYTPMPSQEFAKTYQKFLSKFDGAIVIRSVREGSPADVAGFTAGDLIVGIGPWATTSANDIRWIAGREWAKIQTEHSILAADVIRDGTHYAAEVETK